MLQDRVQAVRTEFAVASFTSMVPTLEMALAFHQAVLDAHGAVSATVARLREQTQGGDYAYCVDIASFMADPLPADHAALQ
ncbi:hypothetical protein ACFQ6E_38885 [Streptomyces sp. NPDC056462]|uniref:hypothetical protein n=1 Tax=Streptomyces sp. NPDC056462 TaxID=3345826 RepID=UPI00367A8223